MGRTSRVPYHQNLYDLLGLTDDTVAPEALWLVEDFEDRHGPLPAAVREWYLVPNAVPLACGRANEDWDVKPGTIWFEYSNIDNPCPLETVLAEFRWTRAETDPAPRWREHVPRPFARVLSAHQGTAHWYVRDDGSDDPAVWQDFDRASWEEVTGRFSDFLFNWVTFFYTSSFFKTPHSRFHPGQDLPPLPNAPPFTKPCANGLWLRTPDEPFAPPVIDFLIDQLGEPDRAARLGGVTTYTFRQLGGVVRVTADAPTLSGGLSAWWVHADTPEQLAALGRLLRPWGTLSTTLRADTDAARDVLRAL